MRPDELTEILRLHQQGLNTRTIAARVRRSTSAVKRAIRAGTAAPSPALLERALLTCLRCDYQSATSFEMAGHTGARHRVTQEERAEIVKLYKDGMTPNKIGDRVVRADSTVLQVLRAAGLPVKTRLEGVSDITSPVAVRLLMRIEALERQTRENARRRWWQFWRK
jgi:hypothetical protein